MKNALARTSVPDQFIAELACILADCAMNSDWTEEVTAAPGKRGTNPELEAWTPKTIHSYLDEHIHGQDEAKKIVSVILWRQLHGERSIAC